MKICAHTSFTDRERTFKDNSKHIERRCNKCGAHIGFIATPIVLGIDEIASHKIPFGKYAEHSLGEVFEKDPGYLYWLSERPQGKISRLAAAYLDYIDSSESTGLEHIGVTARKVLKKLAQLP